MIFLQGNLLESPAAALVNTVNTVGVMGKGIALQFKEAYPETYRRYREACQRQEVEVGKMFIVQDHDLHGPRTIVNFPTKRHWRGKSQLGWIEEGLADLRRYLEENRPDSIAVPPLGCGNGGLKWAVVRPLIEKALSGLATTVYIYEPNEAIKEQLRAGREGASVALNPARAMLLEAMHRYEDDFEPVSLFVANKLVYFLKKLGGPFDERVRFSRSFYGPYAAAVNHVVYRMNGSFLNGLEQNSAAPFEPLLLAQEKYPEVRRYLDRELSPRHHAVLEQLEKLLDGYKSAYSLEILATVAFIQDQHPEYTESDIVREARAWSPRKARLLKSEYVQLAMERLRRYAAGDLN